MAVIYARMSRDFAKERAGVQRQEAECRKLAAQLGLTVERVLVDNDVSASTGVRRPAFEDLLASKPDAVIVWALDRLCRRTADLEEVLKLGVDVHSVQTGQVDLSNPAGRATARTVTAWATFEIEMKNARAKAAREQKLAAGRKAGGRRAWGYTSKMEPHPIEADAVREAYRRVIAGESIGSIARDLNARGLVSPQAGPNGWAPNNLASSLRRGVYGGLLEHQGKQLGDGAWEPLVDRVVWEHAQAVLRDPKRLMHRGQPKTLLAGIAKCFCGARIVGGADNRGVKVYKCSASAHLARTREQVDAHVLERVSEELESLALFPGRSSAGAPVDPALGAELEALEQRLDELASDLELSERVLAKRTAAIETRITELRDLIGSQATAPVGPSQAELDELLDAISAAGGLASATVETQRRAVRYAVRELVILPAGRGARSFDPSTIRLETWLEADADDD
jgi:DNA invertase Pin-like site-specific DNA recombinase